jgi:hypothetical protein
MFRWLIQYPAFCRRLPSTSSSDPGQIEGLRWQSCNRETRTFMGRARKSGGCREVKVPNLVWFIRAHTGEQAWGVHGLKTWWRALDHRRLRERIGIASASALFGQSPSIVSSRAQISGDSMVLALPALTHQFVFLALQAQPVPKGLLAEQLSCSNDAA